MSFKAKQCRVQLVQDRDEFLSQLLRGKLKKKLVYLRKEKIFIHFQKWQTSLKANIH